MKDERMLMKLPIAQAPGQEIAQFTVEQRENWNGQPYEIHHNCFIYTAVRSNGMLTLTVFNHQKQMAFRVFQRRNEYITQFPDKDKPSEKSLSTITAYSRNIYIAGDQADDAIFCFLKADCSYYKIKAGTSGFNALLQYQLQLKKMLLEERYDRIRAEIDNAMLEIRPLPQKVLQWVDSTVMRHARYLFYDYAKGRKTMQGFCTHCGRKVEIMHPKHRGQGFCPECHSRVTFMARGKFSKNYDPTVRDEGRFAYLQSTKDGWCVRLYYVTVWHDVRKLEKAKYDLHEDARYFVRPDEPYSGKLFEWANFKNTGDYRFCKVGYVSMNTTAWIYPANLDTVFHRYQEYKYVPLTDLARHSGKLDASRLHKTITEHPWIEYLIKLKLYRLAADVVNGNGWSSVLKESGKNFVEVLGIRKDRLPLLQKINPNANEYTVLKFSLNQWDYQDMDTLKWLMYYASQGCANAIMAFIRPDKMKKYMLRQLEMRPEDAKPKEHQWRSGTETKEEASKRVLDEIAGDWRDYLDECRQLGYDMAESGVLFPRDLRDAHEKTTTLVEIKENKDHDRKIRKRAATLTKQYAFSDEESGLLIRPISNVGELVIEGKRLHHCVGRYAKDYAEGKTNIFCIRKAKEPDTPYYTLELSNRRNIVQCRGLRNCSITSEIKSFEEKWLKACNKPKKQEKARVAVVA